MQLGQITVTNVKPLMLVVRAMKLFWHFFAC